MKSTTITASGRGIRRNIEVLVAIVVGTAIAAWALTEFATTQTGAGPNGSMFVTDVNGTAALAELATEFGHPAIPVTAGFSSLDPGGTILILEPAGTSRYEPPEVDALREWVHAGGRLVYAGRPHVDLTGTVLPEDISRGVGGRDPAPIVEPIRGVGDEVTGEGIYSVDSGGTPLVGDPPTVSAHPSGEGVVIFVADGSVFWNRYIENNAAWALSLLAEGPARFDEVRHGFMIQPVSERPDGLLASLPDDARSTILLLMVVMLLALVTYGRRFGPPERESRDLAPPRAELVEAAASLLVRARDPVEAAAPVLDRFRATLERQSGMLHGASNEELASAASSVGLEAGEVTAALSGTDEEAMLTAHRLLTQLLEREIP